MELLLVFLVGVGLTAWFFMSRKKMEEQTLPVGQDPESEWIALKMRLMATSAYEQEATYQLLYHRCRELLNGLLSRHVAILSNEFGTDVASLVNRSESIDGQRPSVFVDDKLPLNDLADGEILHLAFYSYNGGESALLGRVDKNTFFANRAIEYLIEKRQYAPAELIKGIIFKYGIQVYVPPKLDEAYKLLSHAYQRGLEGARAELDSISKHSGLTHAKCVQPGKDRDNHWMSYEEIEERMARVAHVKAPQRNGMQVLP